MNIENINFEKLSGYITTGPDLKIKTPVFISLQDAILARELAGRIPGGCTVELGPNQHIGSDGYIYDAEPEPVGAESNDDYWF